ncbi:MAG: hypothetical protein AUJ97_05375 [Bacteroidetes bacterium CG2_30_32_10]|nr:MAG: hypothetical protein AUJ97_05375 [Bacteroidetes bacterium CG2_30_32_10]
MKKKIFLFFTVLLFFTPFATFSQETHDSIKLTERNDAFLNYDNYRSSITDTTIDVLKKLVELQTDLIITDNYIIHNYISINTKKTDDLQKKLQAAKLEKDLLNKKYEEAKQWLLYGLIVAGVFVLSTILFIILFALTINKKKNAINQLTKIEIIKEEQLKEINSLKKESEKQSSDSNNEVNKAKERLENDFKLQLNKYELLNTEKTLLAAKLKEKENAFNDLNTKQNAVSNEKNTETTQLKEEYENKIIALNNEVAQLKQEMLLIQQKENAPLQNFESNQLLEENNLLKTELNQCKDKLNNENKQRIEIENEIKQLIEEIKGIRK